MNKFSVLKVLSKNGDSILNLRGEAPIGCTTDFSTPYIKNKRRRKFMKGKDIILVFSWTDNKFRNLNTNSIISITPLSKILGNTNNG